MKKEVRNSIFYLIVGTMFFYGSINVQYRDGIIRWDNLFDSYALLVVSVVFLVMALVKYIEYKFDKEVKKRKK